MDSNSSRNYGNAFLHGKIVVIHRKENQGFGFTLRHFIAQPPDEWAFPRSPLSGVAGQAQPQMETVFIKEVHLNGPAHAAGLKKGDRLLKVNSIPINGVPYSTIVSIIKQTPTILVLEIVPKECDLLQVYYTDLAHNPNTNRQPQHQQQQQQQSHRSAVPCKLSPMSNIQTVEKPPPINRNVENPQLSVAAATAAIVPTPLNHFTPISINRNDIMVAENLLRRNLRDEDELIHSQQHEFMTRLRKSIEQKEEFLNSPPFNKTSNSNFIQQKEFYSRPNRMHPSWPPANEEFLHGLTTGGMVPTSLDGVGASAMPAMPGPQQAPQSSNMTVVAGLPENNKSRGLTLKIENQENLFSSNECRNNKILLTADGKSNRDRSRDRFNGVLRAQQTSPEMKITEKINELKQTDNGFHVVSDLTKQFEYGRPLSPDGGVADKTLLHKSELSRIKTKFAIPVVTLRKKEIERKMCKSPPPPPVPPHGIGFEQTSSSNASGSGGGGATTMHRNAFNEDNKTSLIQYSTNKGSHKLLSTMATTMGMGSKNETANGNDNQLGKYENCDQFQTSSAMSSSALASQAAQHIVRRYKSIVFDDNKPMRRISYLRATGNENDYNLDVSAAAANNQHVVVAEVNVEKDQLQELKNAQIEELLPSLRGEFNYKSVYVRGKRSHSKTWRPAKVELYGVIMKVDIGRDAKSSAEAGLLEVLSAMDVRGYNVTEDDDAKRKHVFRLTTKPQRKESDSSTGKDNEGTQILFQTRDANELKIWLTALCGISYGHHSTEVNNTTRTPHEKQSAEPQKVAASTTVQTNIYCEETMQHIYAQVTKSSTDADGNFGSPPMLKSRKSSQQKDGSDKEMGSPKTKNWKDLLFRKIHYHPTDASHHNQQIPTTGSIGVPLKQCPMSKENEFVPYLVELCTKIVETKGLNVVGIYRIPGNKAAISELKEQVNRNEFLLSSNSNGDASESKWDDVNVVSSLLKLFIRSLPDALLPSTFYNNFIEADKRVGESRLKELRSLLKALPNYPYETLKHIIRHLHRVSLNCDVNLMEPKNLAIIFGPSIVRTANETLEIAVKDMKHQCRIVELFVSHYEYFFENGPMPKVSEHAGITSVTSQEEEDQTSMLLDNVSKIASLQHQDKESMSSRFIPLLTRRTHAKRSASTSINSDTYSGESIISFESSKKTIEQRSSGSFEFRDKTDQDSVDAASVLTDDDESNTSRLSDTGSMSLTTITDTLDTKLRNLRSIPISNDFKTENNHISKLNQSPHKEGFSQPLTISDNIPYADESPERIVLAPTVLSKSAALHAKAFARHSQPIANSTPSHDLLNYSRDPLTKPNPILRLSYSNEPCSDDSEVSTTSDPKESFIISPLLIERYRKRRGHRLFRSASFNCRNYSGRMAHNNYSNLTKDEKTDMNITKKRQIQNKQNRSIKRRHTVGGPHDYTTASRRALPPVMPAGGGGAERNARIHEVGAIITGSGNKQKIEK